jgi:tetratricopeptide (TPR) repeat protein
MVASGRRKESAIRVALKRDSDNHWLLTRLGLTYYEERRYKRSLFYAEKALALAPKCPLVLWDLSGSLEMLNRTRNAVVIYQQLTKRGVARLANGDCGEGKAWARGLVADCYYRMAHCLKTLGSKKHADAAYRKHLALRGPGCRSIYPLKLVQRDLCSLNSTTVK